MDLRGKTAVVTGSSRGIGRGIALRLAAAGANVVVCGHRSVEEAKQVAVEIGKLDVPCDAVIADLSNREETASMIEHVWGWDGGVDVWVNNAGVDVLTGDSADWSFTEKLQRLWEVDVLGTIACSRDVGARMKQAGGGSIVNIGWDQAWSGMEGDSGEMFATIKGAVMAFTMSLAKSLAPDVRVNCVAPGWIKTAWGNEASGYWSERAVSESLRGRWGTPKDVAETVCFLSSNSADFITGQIIPVNGGFRSSKHR